MMDMLQQLKCRQQELGQQIARTKAQLILAQAQTAELQTLYDGLLGRAGEVERLLLWVDDAPPRPGAEREG
jgi:hypothetical protein